MPRYVPKGSPHSITYQFEVGGQLVTPDPGSVRVSLFDNSGTPVGDWDEKAVTVTAPASKVQLNFSGADNTTFLEVGIRTVRIDFYYSGGFYSDRIDYLLTDDAPLPVSDSEVVAVLGLLVSDVPPDMIDVAMAVDTLERAYPIDVRAIVAAGTKLTLPLLRAVKLQAALTLSVTLENWVMQMEQADNALYRRFEEIDFSTMRESLKAELAALMQTVTGNAPAVPVLGILTTETDVITGG